MEEIKSSVKKFILTKFIFALFLFFFLNYYIKSPALPPDSLKYFYLMILALIFEVTSFKLPFFGTVNPSFAVYFSILILFGPGFAIVSVFINSIIRILIVNYPNFWLNIADFSDTLITACLCCLTYRIINNDFPFLSAANIGALCAVAIVYFALEYLLASVFMGLNFPEKQKMWNESKIKTSLINLSVIPCAVAIAVLYGQNVYFVLLIAPILFIMRYMYAMSIYAGRLKIQEFAENKMRYIEAEMQRIKENNVSLNSDLQKKVDELSIFFELGHVLGANLRLEVVLENIIYMIRRLIFCQSCVIFLYNREKELIPYKYSTPYKEALEASGLLKLEENIIKMVISGKQAVLLGDIRVDLEQRIFKDESSAMGIPLIIQNELLGVIYVGDKNPNSFTSEHLQSVSHLANASAIAIKSALLFEDQEEALDVQQKINKQLDSRIKEISLISDFGRVLGSTLHLKETLNIIADSTKNMLNYQSCVVFLTEGEGEVKKFIPRQITSPYRQYFEEMKIDYKDGLLGWVYANKKVLLLEDVKDSVLGNLINEEQSVILSPLIVENETIGVIYFGASAPYSFNGDMLGFVVSISYQAAMAIKNAQFYERIAALAITDGITGLYTHRYFQERLEESVKWAARYNKPISLIFLDLDHFKQFNDTLGHPQGDNVLKEVAEILRAYTRETDLVCRYGGDEFAIVLSDIGKEKAAEIAERIRSGFLTALNKYSVQITGSIGVATFPQDAKTKVELILKADTATYKSKHEGKNKVTVA